MLGGGALPFQHSPFLLKMEPQADPQADPQTSMQVLEKQIAALKKENTKLKNEMRFNLDQEKFVKFPCR